MLSYYSISFSRLIISPACVLKNAHRFFIIANTASPLVFHDRQPVNDDDSSSSDGAMRSRSAQSPTGTIYVVFVFLLMVIICIKIK